MLTRFGVAIDKPLLAELDEIARDRRCTRSELLRDLARAEVVRAKAAGGAYAVAALTIVYDHHARDLGEKLTDLQHELGEDVRASLHVHLSHDYCLETIVLRGRADELSRVANRIRGMRGVKHGSLEIITDVWRSEDELPRATHDHGLHADDMHAQMHAKTHAKAQAKIQAKTQAKIHTKTHAPAHTSSHTRDASSRVESTAPGHARGPRRKVRAQP